MEITFYSRENIVYLDFSTLRSQYPHSRADLYRYLKYSSIKKIQLNNRFLYSFDDIMKDPWLSGKLGLKKPTRLS